jgi:hypothetical protein
MNGIHKLIDVLKLLIHGGVTQLCHFINPTQFFEHYGDNVRRRNLTAARFKLVHDFIHRVFQGKKTSGTFFESFRDADGQFPPIKWFMGSVTLHHAQIGALDFFVRSKAILTLQTFAATTDTRTIPRLTGIDDLVITRPALGATHSMRIAITTLFLVVSMLL